MVVGLFFLLLLSSIHDFIPQTPRLVLQWNTCLQIWLVHPKETHESVTVRAGSSRRKSVISVTSFTVTRHIWVCLSSSFFFLFTAKVFCSSVFGSVNSVTGGSATSGTEHLRGENISKTSLVAFLACINRLQYTCSHYRNDIYHWKTSGQGQSRQSNNGAFISGQVSQKLPL